MTLNGDGSNVPIRGLAVTKVIEVPGKVNSHSVLSSSHDPPSNIPIISIVISVAGSHPGTLRMTFNTARSASRCTYSFQMTVQRRYHILCNIDYGSYGSI